ncbi:hypothetical protein [Flammeovirga sp. OC4]|uniref:hypothetical protein n=1 Tax=Flammeovirga sp. OC4 TaxID=1382345 RepID=UPI0005C4BB93|nr:hypothetical protein [Flammeovirga sp. OC4]
MKRIILLILIFTPSLSFGQIENRWQPDSVYSNRQVKKVFVYLNSPKDLSEIVEFDTTGKRIRSTKFSASYNKKTRKLKGIDKVSFYEYDSKNHLIRIIDSLKTDSTIFKYGNDNKLISSQKRLGNFVYETMYKHNPLVETTIRRKDSVIVYNKTKEYDKDFYVSRFYGFYLEPKLKNITDTIEGVPNTTAYKDYDDLEKFKDNKIIKNSFDSNSQLIKSEIKSIFLNDRINEYELNYSYYKNGLLKSIRGYIPRYFKYEFWD